MPSYQTDTHFRVGEKYRFPAQLLNDLKMFGIVFVWVVFLILYRILLAEEVCGT
jgi:hypothetical protein